MHHSNKMGTVFFNDAMPTVATQKVREALDRSGLDTKLARDLSKRFCFVRAKNRLRQDGLIDQVNETQDRWIWQLSRRYREQNRLGYEFEASFWFDKATETVGADNPALLEQVETLFAKYGGLHLPSDIGKLVHRIFDKQKGMIKLRHHGAVYFVPDENKGLLDKAVAFINEIGGQCVTVPVGLDNGLVRQKAMDMLTESVRSDLTRVVDQMRKMREDGQEFTKRKARHRWRELCGQLDRVKTFARSLCADANEILKEVSSEDLDLSLVAKADVDVIAALAHAGKLNGTLGQIVRTGYEGELPAIRSARVQAVRVQLGEQKAIQLPVVQRQALPVLEA